MQLVTLESVKQQLSVATPLPFNVRQSDGTLLLARGQVLHSHQQMEALFERGMLVDLAELTASAAPRSTRASVLAATSQQLPALWQQSIARAGQVLVAPPLEGLDELLDDVAQPLLTLVERDPDLAIFQVLRQHGNRHTEYGVNHSIHCAIAAFLSATRLGWDMPELQRAFKAALTMNISMLELQGQLATQTAPLTPLQRDKIHSHPMSSVKMLELAGVDDAEWLQAVAQHHESGDAQGYPSGRADVSPLAALLRQCDIYTAKLSPRRSREAQSADMAARRLFAANPRDATTTALIKEFGLYPPGACVRLASGETGVVVRRGAAAHTPRVAVTHNARGIKLGEAAPRDTAQPAHAVTAVLSYNQAPVDVATEKLMAMSFG